GCRPPRGFPRGVTKRRTRRAAAPPPSGVPAASPRADLLASVLVFAAAAAVFWPTVGYSFLNWDDPVYILENPWIRAFTWANVTGVFTHPYFQNYLPLHLLSYMVDHALWGLKAGGYHLGSVLFHAVNSV